MDLQDRRVQDDKQRALEIELNRTIQAAIKDGLHPERALFAASNLYQQEQSLSRSRDAMARSYL